MIGTFRQIGYRSQAIETPISFSPNALYVTHRVPLCQSSHIMRVRRVVAGDEVDVYDFRKGTTDYKLIKGGAWVDGSAETFFVTTWYDQTGNAQHLLQATAADQPSLIMNSQNGWPKLDTDNNKTMQTAGAYSWGINVAVIAAIKTTANSDPRARIMETLMATHFALAINLARDFYVAHLNKNVNAAVAFDGVTLTDKDIITYYYDGTNGIGYKNGQLSASTALTAPSADSHKLTLGSEATQTTWFFDGDYYALVMMADLTTIQRQSIERYLNSKYKVF